MANIAPAGSGGAGFTQGLLGALQPWLTGGSPSALNAAFAQDGGTTGLLSAMLQDSPGSQGAAAFGRALQANQHNALVNAAARQGLASQGLGLELKSAMLPMQLAMMRSYYGGVLGTNPAAQGAGGAPRAPSQAGAPFAVTPAIAGAANSADSGAAAALTGAGYPSHAAAPIQPGVFRSAQPSAAAASPAQSAPNPFSVPTPGQIASMPIGGLPPNYGTMWAFMNNKDPVGAATAAHAEQVQLAQEQYGPVLAQLDTLDKAQSPTQYVSASPALQSEWNRIAPTLGFDPVKGFNNANVRTAFAFLRNRIAGALGEPTVAPPVQLSTTAGPLNSIFQRNPITGALQQVKPEDALKSVVGPNGNVRYVAASQAPGQTPFNDMTYIDPTTTAGVANLIANYQAPPLNGFALRTPQGQAIMAEVKQLNPKYDATAYQTKQTARTAFATGKQGNIVRSLSVATNHLDQLAQAAHALAQGNLPAVNALVNAYARHTGNPSVTSFKAMTEVVGDEVAKAVIGSGGSESDREAIKEAFNPANSPRQIQGVITHFEGLMGGQLAGLRRQYQRATGLDDFNSFVSQLARQKLTATSRGNAASAAQALSIGQSRKLGQFTVTRIK